jgi:homoserine dehydrogenase
MAGNSFERIYGILNGTCNYILTRMEQDKMPFAECLKEAQRLGYAEADPSFDIEGHDTAQKLAILASLAFGTKVDQSAIYVEGISSITPADLHAADELGYRVKLLGVAVKTPKGIEQRVHPTMVRKDSAIAQVMGVDQRRDGRCGGYQSTDPGWARRGRGGDCVRGPFRYWRYRAGCAHRAL